MSTPLLWLVAALVLFLLELLTPGFVLACFGVGALFACLPALFGWHIIVQVLFFAIGSILSLFLLRPLVNKKKSSTQATGVDALRGRVGRVVRTIEGDSKQGRVAIDGDEWPAIASNSNETIPEGCRVEVIGNESIILSVRRVNKEN